MEAKGHVHQVEIRSGAYYGTKPYVLYGDTKAYLPRKKYTDYELQRAIERAIAEHDRASATLSLLEEYNQWLKTVPKGQWANPEAAKKARL